jgi:hypothetical protein
MTSLSCKMIVCAKGTRKRAWMYTGQFHSVTHTVVHELFQRVLRNSWKLEERKEQDTVK